MPPRGPDDVGEGHPGDADAPPEEIVLEPTDVLDLHSFPPRDVAELVRDYLDVAVERGWPQVRIVHGKGAGVQRERVRSILAADSRVEAFGDAPGEAGGWGATWARLRPHARSAPAGSAGDDDDPDRR
jgi:DNA-nicking Smr family endonuclease